MKPAPNTNLGSARRVFVLCYAASGTAALVYQVVWMRLFTLQLGHTVAASSTVLAAFMGGLAIGAWLAGRATIPFERSLRIYAALEIFVAIAAVVLPTLLPAMTPALAWAYEDGNGTMRLALVRVALSLMLLGIPACAMGATFPIAASWLADAGLLYAVNSAGAAVGAIAAGFWLIPSLGLRGTTWTGVCLNIFAATGAYWLSWQETKPEPPTTQPAGARSRAAPAHLARPQLAAAAACLTGFLALVYEVVWTRLIALLMGPTTYAFATMVASFISGIAIGSMVGTRLARRTAQPMLWLAAAIIMMVVSAAAAAGFAASRLPLVLARNVAGGADFGSVIAHELLYIAALLLPTSFASGVTFPLALAAAKSSTSSIARDTARVYAANTVGAVAGALAAGFLLIPSLGLQATFAWMTRVGAIGAAAIAVTLLGRTLSGVMVVGLALLALVEVFPDWDRNLLASGPYKYGRYIAEEAVDASLRAGQLDYYKEGAAGTVSVRRLGGSLALAIDGKVDASNAGDMLTQRMLGLLPVLLHPHPQDLLVIGLGSGVTAATALASNQVTHADILEISPEVVEASALFNRENRDVLKAPAVRLLVGDGRSHLLLSRRQYDVIVSEPSNPWMAGVAALFTREFFEAARARLKPGGVLCQWAHTYEIAEDDLKSIAATFASVFPQGTMWLVGDGDLLLIGAADRNIESSLADIPERLTTGAIAQALEDVSIEPASAPFVVLSMLAGGPAELAAYSKGARLQTDDRMVLEFTAARAIYSRVVTDNTERIHALRSGALFPAAVASIIGNGDSRNWVARGRVALKANAYEMARDSFRRAVVLDTRAPDALRGLSEAAAGKRELSAELSWLRALADAEPRNAPVRVELSHVLASMGEVEGAISAATDAGRLEPDSPEPMEQLASIFADMQDAARLTPLAETLVARFPQRADSRYYYAASLFLRGRPAEAAQEARRILALDPRRANAQNLLGAACATAGDFECAKTALERAVQLNPRDAAPLTNLGFFHLQAGNRAAAIAYFSEAVAVDPESDAARKGLLEARAAGPAE